MADVVVAFRLIFPFWLSSVKLQCILNFNSPAPEGSKPARSVNRYSTRSSSAAWTVAGKLSPWFPDRLPSPCWMELGFLQPFAPDVFAEPANQMPLVLVVVVGDLHFKLNRINSVVVVGSSPPAFLLSSQIA